MQAFTRKFSDKSTVSGFQFIFYCDNCKRENKSQLIESKTYKKAQNSKLIGQSIGLVGGIIGGKTKKVTNTAKQSNAILTDRNKGKNPEWQKEQEKAFELCQSEAKKQYKVCPSCKKYVCFDCWKETDKLCEGCIVNLKNKPAKQSTPIATKTSSKTIGAMSTSGQTLCSACGKTTPVSKYCSYCGFTLEGKPCSLCQTVSPLDAIYCHSCGADFSKTTKTITKTKMVASAKGSTENASVATKYCISCGTKLPLEAQFCAECGGRQVNT